MKSKKRIGRPPGSGENYARIFCRIPPAELRATRAAARRLGLSVSEFIRAAISRAVRKGERT
jgi:hypothetical protein